MLRTVIYQRLSVVINAAVDFRYWLALN